MTTLEQAREFIRKFETLEDLDMMAHAKAGDSRRAHDFVRVDLPLMMDMYQGNQPLERTDLSPRQEALLELTPRDMADQISSNMRGAKLVIGWNAPFAKDEMKEFILGRDEFTGDLYDEFIAQQGVRRSPDLSSGYTNSAENPLDPQTFSKVVAQESHLGYFRPGDKVIVDDKDRSPTDDPYSQEAKRIEEVQFSQREENSPYYYTQFRREGETEFHNRGDLLDPRGTQHTYGIIAEGAGRLYFVETETPSGRHEPEDMIAREIIGVERSMTDRQARDIQANINNKPAYELGQFDSNSNEEKAPTSIPQNAREALALDQDNSSAISGEFAFHSVDGPNDKAGPIIIEANSWSAGVGKEEKEWAMAAIERHLEKYEYPWRDMVTEAYETKEKASPTQQTIIGEPKVETSRSGHLAAAVAAGMGRGM